GGRTPHRRGRGRRGRCRPGVAPAEGGLPTVNPHARTARAKSRIHGSALLLMLALFVSMAAPSFASPRESVRLDSGWRFHRGDPPGVDGCLDYDVRPEVIRSADGKVADARPDEAARVQADRPVLKPWILPTANRFIAEPGLRHARPDIDPAVGDVEF